MRFEKGNKINLGRKRPDMIGNKLTLGVSPWNKGLKIGDMPKEHKLSISKSLKERFKKLCGNTKGMKFGPHSEKTKENISNALKGKYVGPLAPSWAGGKSIEKYDKNFTQRLKNKIRERDNYQCQHCDMTEEEHLIVIGASLQIHHVDYDKTNSDPNNLISLCNFCHSRTNFNRDYWKNKFNARTPDRTIRP